MAKTQKSYLLSDKAISDIEAIHVLEKKSRNQVIEQAVSFYLSYLTTESSQDYLCSILGSKVEGIINLSNQEMGRLLFKLAVEMNVLTRALGSQLSIDRESYNRLRKAAVDDAKATKGIISLYQT